jgi:hypothetical protein
VVSSTPSSGGGINAGHVIDESIDWRYRYVWGFISYIGAGNLFPVESGASAGVPPSSAFIPPSLLSTNNIILDFNYGVSSQLFVGVDAGTPGKLRITRNGIEDGTNGDGMVLVLDVSDRFVAGM